MAIKKTPYSQTKEGKVSSLRWAYITQLKLNRSADMNYYLAEMCKVIAKGTRFEADVKAVLTSTPTTIRRMKKA